MCAAGSSSRRRSLAWSFCERLRQHEMPELDPRRPVMATFGDAHACGGQALGEELARARIAVLPAVAEKDLRQRGIAEGAEKLGFAVRAAQAEKRREQHQLADRAAIAAGLGDQPHAAELDAEQAGLGTAAPPRPHDLLLALCNVPVLRNIPL